MKKSTKMLALVALFAAGLSFTSCKKCIECEVTYMGTTNTDEECYSSVSERKENQKDADEACEDIKAKGGTCSCKAK